MAGQEPAAGLPSVMRFGSVMDGTVRLAWRLRGSYSVMTGIYSLSVALFNVGGKFLGADFPLEALVDSEFAAKEPAEWLEELQTFLPGAVELKVVPGKGLCLSVPLANSPDRLRFRLPPEEALVEVAPSLAHEVTAGAFGELIDECAVQYGKGLEALRVREANEQLQAEVAALKQQLAVAKEQLKRQRSNGSGSLPELKNMDSSELRRYHGNPESHPPPTFAASQPASEPQPPPSHFAHAAGRAPDQAQPTATPTQRGQGEPAGVPPGGAPPGDERLPLDYKPRVVPSRGRGRRPRGGLLGTVKGRR